MGELFITILVFIAVGGLAAVLLFVWLILNLAQLLRRAFGGRAQPPLSVRDAESNACAVPNCRAINPTAARFCRRCGHPVGDPLTLPPRQPMRANYRRRYGQTLREM